MKFSLGLVAFASFMFVGFAPSEADAGIAGCVKGLAACKDEAKNVGGAIKSAREACQALRGCKKECRDTKTACKKACKGSADKKACRTACKGSKKACKAACKEQYKTPECKAARKSVVKAVAKEGLSCAKKVGKDCL